MELRPIIQNDFADLVEIYRQGIETGFATFETSLPDWQAWHKQHLEVCRIAAFEKDIMTGWAALTPVSGRCVYAGVAEVSVYVSQDFRGKKVGEILLRRLTQESEKAGIWTLQSGIFSDNMASIRLHEKCGFRMVGFREKIGQRNGVWKNTVLMERRSNVI